ncbi:MAG: TetR/AcrR family transcriptional regulator [Polyangia bacterium]
MPRAAAGRPPRSARPGGGRVPRDTRRRQLLDVTAQILTAQGVEHVQITEVAERAGVSRPLVYRLFPTRRALVEALLQDFAARLGERFQAALLTTWPGTLEDITRAFVAASCAAIEEEGAGPWQLLDARGTDPELARLGREILAELLKPWRKRLAELTGLPPRRTANLLWIVVAAGRAALDGWIEGSVSRRAAIDDATRAVAALLQSFIQAPDPVQD